MVRKQRRRNEEGQTMVEFAVILPVLAFVHFAILQFGITLNNYITLTNAVRDGARKGVTSRASTSPDAVTVTKNAVKASAVDLDQSSTNCSVSLCVTVTPASASSWVPGGDLTVTATYPYSISLFGLIVKSGTLSSTVTERIE
jgi:Flp pilus assembly protein TadG